MHRPIVVSGSPQHGDALFLHAERAADDGGLEMLAVTVDIEVFTGQAVGDVLPNLFGRGIWRAHGRFNDGVQ